MATPTIVGTAAGFPAQYGQHIQNSWSTAQGDSVVVSPTAGNTLVCIVFGLKSPQPFDLFHGSSPDVAYFPGFNDFAAAPTISDSGSDAAAITAVSQTDAVLTLTAATAHTGPFTLTQVVDPSCPFTLSAVANSVGSSAVYTGTITGGDNNNFVGMSFTIAGFVGSNNNGTFLCTASDALTLTLANSAATAESATASATNAVATDAVYVGTITGGAGNAFANYTFDVTGFDTSANNGTFTCVSSTATTLILTNSSRVADTHAGSASAGAAGATVYIGTITGGATNGLAGYYFTVAGFTNASNNGYFLCTASTATELTLANASPVSEVHAGTATDYVVTITAANNFFAGDSVTLAGLTTKTWLNGQTQKIITVSSSQFTVNDSSKHATSGSASDTGTATRSSANDWVAAVYNLVNGDSDYTASLGDFTRSSKWALDGKYPSIYMFYALNVTGGTYKVTVNSCYQDGTTRPGDLAAGKPILNGGVDIIVLEFSGIVTSAATDGNMRQMSASLNSDGATVTPSFITSYSGDLILTAGLMKNGSSFSAYQPTGTTGTVIVANGKCVSTQAHWAVQMQLQTAAGAITPGFLNPLGYEMAVQAIALKHA